jgi:hypothetical protein
VRLVAQPTAGIDFGAVVMQLTITPQIKDSILKECEGIALYLTGRKYTELPERRQETIYHMALKELGLKRVVDYGH